MLKWLNEPPIFTQLQRCHLKTLLTLQGYEIRTVFDIICIPTLVPRNVMSSHKCK